MQQQQKSQECSQNAQKIKQVLPEGNKKNCSQETRAMPKSTPKVNTDLPGTSTVRATAGMSDALSWDAFHGYEWKGLMAT